VLGFHLLALLLVLIDPTLPTATSVDVERLFSRGRLVLSHTRSRLSVASTRALLCLGSWSLAGLVRDEDVAAVVRLDEVDAAIELDKLAERGHLIPA
jgi:hypothetical protein